MSDKKTLPCIPKTAWSIDMNKKLDSPGQLRMAMSMHDGGYYQGYP